MGAELSRLRSGKKTRTGMSETQLRHFAGSVHKKGTGGSGSSPIKFQKREGGTNRD